MAGVNTSGGSNYLASGLAWRFDLAERSTPAGIGSDPRRRVPSLADEPASRRRAAEAARRLPEQAGPGLTGAVRAGLTLGWKATERLSSELSWIHLSHARLAGHYNPGVADVGLRFSYRYGLDRGV
jgi:hypothetical protein